MILFTYDPIYVLRGVGGSHAHGLAHAESDEDMRGVFSFPTEAFFGLAVPPESLTTTDPDSSAHELSKFLRLAMKANPDVLDILALDSYTDMEDKWGQKLLDLQPKLLGADAIRAAFFGYAKDQFMGLQRRAEAGNESFSAGMSNRTWKHAKHMFRLLEAAERLLTTGKISPRVGDRGFYLDVLPKYSLNQLIQSFNVRYAEVKNTPTRLPKKPDYDAVHNFLVAYRKAH